MSLSPGPKDWIQALSTQRVDLPGRSIVGAGIIAGIGLCTCGMHLYHFISEPAGLFITLLGTVLPMGLSIVLLAVGLQLYRRYPTEVVLWASLWCVVGTTVLFGVSVVSVIYQNAKGVMMVDLLFVVTNHMSVGGVLGLCIGIYDGQRRKHEHNLQREHNRAQAASNRLSVLNRVLRHDIRNIVTVIQGNATLLLNEEKNPERAAEIIHSKASELEEVSDLARELKQLMERESTEIKSVDIEPIVREKVARVRDQNPHVNFETDIPMSIKTTVSPLIGRAIEELLENAVEHNDTDNPQVAVTVSTPTSGLQADGGGPETVVITIRDNGPGIPYDQLEVLERGREIDLEHTNGLGLWLVRWVVDISGGEISFKTGGRRGTTIDMELPTVEHRDET